MDIIEEPISNYLTDRNKELYTYFANIAKEYNAIIAGGSARQIFLDEKFGSTDIDLYFSSMKYFLSFRSIYRNVIEKSSSYATTYIINNIKVQIIKITPGNKNIYRIFDTYDFYCCRFAIYNDTIFYTHRAKKDALNKVFSSTHNENYPDNELDLWTFEAPKDYRLLKYYLKGYEPGNHYCQVAFSKLIRNLLITNDMLYVNDIINSIIKN